ncbi:tetratricopeptide repeat protein [Luteimonas sp. MC1828]|uniref:tetratricopeptide repeat protein n=1 Tax=Luteimonas sp. MC1828 TaxID=2799787 RepID=UPI0018F18D97|nr:tetratricopeptide repeat protein [Luteimonas sp. MC1828]MBJ7575373.1 tetratricopeptide repeat protein [Luteimonas sp. MC1828]
MQQEILDALGRGDNDAALVQARDLVAATPDDPQAQRMLALALRAAGDVAGAREAIERALALAPDDASLHLYHAGLLLGGRDLDAARAALETTIGLDPNKFSAYIIQAQLAIARNDLDEAERLVQLAARVAPDHPTLMAVQGTLQLRRGNSKDALALLSSAARRVPDDALINHALGFAYLAEGHLAFAEQAFRNLIATSPAAQRMRPLLAQIALRQGRLDDAAAELAPLLADPATATPGLRRLAGEIELAAGRVELALPHLRVALAAMPGDPATLAAITAAWRRSGEVEDARQTLDALLATSPASDALWRARLAFEPGGPGADALVARWRQLRPGSIAAMEAEMLGHVAARRVNPAEALAREILARQPGHPGAEMSLIEVMLDTAPTGAIERLDAAIAALAPGADSRMLRARQALARHRAGDRAGALAQWIELHAESAAERVPLHAHSAPPAAWPEQAAPRADAPAITFLFGAPGSLVERLAQLLAAVVPDFRDDRFSFTPPDDVFQNLPAIAAVASGELSADKVVASWRSALPSRRIDGAVIDWLPIWDNAYAAVMRSALPEARLLVPLRDPRDMLLDWLAFGAPTHFRVTSPEAAAEWLAQGLGQVASLHEQDLVPHRLLRLDDIVEDPVAVAAQLGAALDITLPPPPAHFFGGRRLAAGTWRAYSDLLADAFAHLHPVAQRLGYPLD